MARPFRLTPYQGKEALRRCGNGEPVQEIAKSYNVSDSTISWLEKRTDANA